MTGMLTLLAGLVVIGWIALKTLQTPDHPSRQPFLLTTIFGALWYLLGIATALAPTPGTALFWTRLSPLGMVPTYWLTLLFITTQIGSFPRRWHLPAYAAIAGWTAFLLLLHLVPDWHGVFARYQAIADPDGRILLERTRGPLYLPVLCLNLAAYAATVGLVLRHVLRSARLHRVQSLGMLVGTLIPFAAYVLQAAFNAAAIDVTLLAFVPACLVFYLLTVRRNLLTSAPIPRHFLIDAIPDPILVVSEGGVILEANRAAQRLAGMGEEPIGTRLSQHTALAASLASPLRCGDRSLDLVLEVTDAATPCAFDVEITPYPDPVRPIGRVLVFRDVTARSAMERRLFDTLSELRARLDENRQLQTRLRDQAIHDPLTRLFNRHHCAERHVALMAQAQRDGQPMALVLMDIDHFKSINDRFGHPAGDAVLVAFADNLNALKPPGCELFRYGGEEFLALLPATPARVANALVAQWRERFLSVSESLAPVYERVGFSAGIAVFPADAADWSTLVSRADVALYGAKSAGRCRTQLWANGGPCSAAQADAAA